MTQGVKVPAAESGDLSLMSRTDTVGGENLLCTLSWKLHIYLWHVYINILHTHEISK